jgi:phospholipid/cholesterol/gamma-HCH transport system permease protein
LANQVGATSLAGAASGLAVIRQAASLVAAVLMIVNVGISQLYNTLFPRTGL